MCHRHNRQCLRRKIFVMWRNVSTWQIVMWRNSSHGRLSWNSPMWIQIWWINVKTNLSGGGISPHEKCGTNLFCHNIRCLVSKIVSVERKKDNYQAWPEQIKFWMKMAVEEERMQNACRVHILHFDPAVATHGWYLKSNKVVPRQIFKSQTNLYAPKPAFQYAWMKIFLDM